jgi:pantetheine-phosphate adenylyltransferase
MNLLFPGSFDPPHLGHLDLITRGAALGGRLVVAVAVHPDKRGWLPVEHRVSLLRACCAHLAQVEVATYQGATLHFARERHLDALLRGVRSAADLDHERAMAEHHRQLGLDTILLLAPGALAHLSSSFVRQVHAAGLGIEALVPPAVAAALTGSAPLP